MNRRQLFSTTALAMLGLVAAACGSSPAGPTTAPAASPATSGGSTPTGAGATPAATAASVASPTAPPATAAASASTPSAVVESPVAAPTADPSTTQAASSSAVRYTIVPDGTKAGYRVREQLASLKAPSDAVGTTGEVTGSIVLGPDGKVDSDQSKITVDMASLKSDSSMRDGYIKGRTLDVAQYPTATFVPTAITGLPSPLPTSGQHTFTVTGNLTAHGVTKPVTWDVTAAANGKNVTGQASTAFKFEDFGMTPPSTMMVLSVVDNIKLEVTLNLTRES